MRLCPIRLRMIDQTWIVELTWRGSIYQWLIGADGITRI